MMRKNYSSFLTVATALALALMHISCGGGGGGGEGATGAPGSTEYVGTYSGMWHNSLYNQNGTLELVITSYTGTTLAGYVNDHEGEGNVPFADGHITGNTFSATVDYASGQSLVMNGSFSTNGATTLSGTYQSSPSAYGYGTYSVSNSGTSQPSVTTLSATSASATGATLNGNVTPNGQATTAWFEWGTDSSLATYSSTPKQSAGSGTTSQSVNAEMTGLAAGTTYYFRVAASNASGTTRGAVSNFTTSSPGSAPSVTSLPATSVSASGATLNGSVTANGLATMAWFEWGTDPSLAAFSSTPTQSVGSSTSGQPVTAALSGLSAATTYYCRVAASNASGTTRGAIVNFTTSPPSSWVRFYGGPRDEYGSSVRQIAGAGYLEYVVVGALESFNGTTDVILLPVDPSDTVLYKPGIFGGTGNDVGLSVQQAADGGFIVVGHTESFGAGGRDVYLLRTQGTTNAAWERTFGGTADDAGTSVQQTSDGGHIIAGWTGSFGAGSEDVYLIKTDASGNALWTKTFGGTGTDVGQSVQQTADGGYIIAGLTNSFGAGSFDVYLIKTDTSGNAEWEKTFGGVSDDSGYEVQQTADGGYIIAGTTASFGAGNIDVYLIKTNASGNAVWTKSFGGPSDDLGDSVQQTTDAGYIITGYTGSYGAGAGDVYLIKTDASGNAVWTRTFGGTAADRGYSVQQTTDGGHIITGFTESFGNGGKDIYLIKTDANGDVQ